MATKKLIVEYNYDFELFGIISQEKEYKLAWRINNQINIHLIKADDIILEFIKSGKITISNYIFQTENADFRLLKNRSENNKEDRIVYLMPELSKFDFLIIKNGALDGMEDKDFVGQLKQINEVQYIARLETKNLKSKENLIF